MDSDPLAWPVPPCSLNPAEQPRQPPPTASASRCSYKTEACLHFSGVALAAASIWLAMKLLKLDTHVYTGGWGVPLRRANTRSAGPTRHFVRAGRALTRGRSQDRWHEGALGWLSVGVHACMSPAPAWQGGGGGVPSPLPAVLRPRLQGRASCGGWPRA